MFRTQVAWLCIFCLLGCTSNATLPGPQNNGLMSAREEGNGSLRLIDQQGEEVYLQPDDTLKIHTTDGEVTEAKGRDLCRSLQGLSLRINDGPCAQGNWIASWDEVASLEVEQFDGASSVAISTAAAVLVVGALIVLASSGDKGKKSSSSKPEKSGHTPASPVAGGAVKPAERSGSAPVRQRPPHHHTHGGYTGVNIFILSGSGSSSSGGSSEERGSFAPPALTEEEQPIFSGRAQRRATILPFVRGDFGGCVGSESCAAGSVRGGVIVKDFVDLSGGIRWDRLGQDTSPMFVLGAGLQGKFTSFPSLALALGSLVTFGEKVRVAPYAGLRGYLGAGIWAGLQPLGVTFFLPEKRIAYTPSLDLSVTF